MFHYIENYNTAKRPHTSTFTWNPFNRVPKDQGIHQENLIDEVGA